MTSLQQTDDRGPQLIGVCVAFLCITIISCGLRIFTRLRLVKWLGADDILIVCAAAAAIVEGASTIIATKYGLGRHIEEQLPQWREPYVKADLAASLAYSTSAMFIKLSLLAFYLRLSPNPTFRLLTFIMIFVSASFGIASILVAGLQCIPVSVLWDPSQPGHCINVNMFYFANAGIHILTEMLIYILPIRTLWQLHLPIRQKLGLCGLMGLGAMLIVISCYRIETIRDLLSSDDITWNVTTPLMWYTIELNLAIFIACGPAFLAFFRHYLPTVFGGSSNRSKNKTDHYKNSFPLGSVGRSGAHADKTGTKTTITTKHGPYFGDDNNSSEEMIIMSNSGIQKQVDVWVENEDRDLEAAKSDAGKSDSRSPSAVDDGVGHAL